MALPPSVLDRLCCELSAQENNYPCYYLYKQEGTERDFLNSGDLHRVPPTGIEPVHPPPEGGALSPELRGRRQKGRLYDYEYF